VGPIGGYGTNNEVWLGSTTGTPTRMLFTTIEPPADHARRGVEPCCSR